METQPRSLNTLYKLLWEQIKDKKLFEMNDTYFEALDLDVTFEEERLICNNIIEKENEVKMSDPFTKTGVKQRKQFVQRMIKETEKQ